jgi:AcrR family transcriptional regulator
MEARQAAVDSTRERIMQVAYDMWLEQPYDQITVEAVAVSAGVSRQTVIRHFGSKDELAMAVVDWQRPHEEASRAATPGDIPSAVERLIDRYETMGDGNVRILELEGRVPAVSYLLEQARASHRNWVATTLLPSHAPRRGSEREQIILALFAATDVTLWKLLRRDLGQSRPTVEAIIRRIVEGVIEGIPKNTRSTS